MHTMPQILCLFAGAIALSLGIIFGSRLIRYRRFPAIDGQLISAAVSAVRTQDHNGVGMSYIPVVAYSYSVGAAHFTSSRVYSLDDKQNRCGHALRASAQKFCDALASKPSLTVYYNPADPSFAFLRNGPCMVSILIPFLVGGVFIIVGLWFNR
jgi:hypothetical protein